MVLAPSRVTVCSEEHSDILLRLSTVTLDRTNLENVLDFAFSLCS